MGKAVTEPLELAEGEDDCGVGGSDAVKEITGNDHHVGSGSDNPINGSPERLGDVGFPLVDAGGRLTVVLPDAQMGIGDVGELHGWRMK
jgi:hypothetical protein